MSTAEDTSPDEVAPTESAEPQPTGSPTATAPDDGTTPATDPCPAPTDPTGSTGSPADQAEPAGSAESTVATGPRDGDEEKGEPAETTTRAPHERAPRTSARRLTARVAAPGLLIGVLCALLGFGLAVQVRTTSSTSGLSSARQEDLVRILDDLSSREDRLRQQISSLETARGKLSSSGDKASVALSEARNRSTTLGILAGTIPAQGPGIRLTINDPAGTLDAENLLDAVEELRAAGGEAFQVGVVRIGVSTAFTDQRGAVVADSTPLDRPYVLLAIGDPGTLATALNIPGGVVASVRNAGGQATITQENQIVINAVRQLTTPDHARPATEGDN